MKEKKKEKKKKKKTQIERLETEMSERTRGPKLLEKPHAHTLANMVTNGNENKSKKELNSLS